MKYLVVFAFTMWACSCYSQSANNFTNIPVRTENSYPFAATPKFQDVKTGQGLGIIFNFKKDTLALLLDHVSEKSIKKNLLFLADYKYDDQDAGMNSDSITADFINQWAMKYNLLDKLPGFLNQTINNRDNIAIAAGSNKKAGYIFFIAHRNHNQQPFDSSNDDNVSGTVVLLECAKAIAALSKEGIYPERTIVFICTPDDEYKKSNTTYFTQHSIASTSKIKADLNIDLITRWPDSNKVDNNYVYTPYYDSVYNSKNVIENVNQKNNLLFIPHKPNCKLLTQKTKLALNVLWKLANN